MPFAIVNDTNAHIYYEDTGAPSATYVTVVLVHGAGFHGASFRRLVPLAAEHNLRFIIPNLRDYPHSTPYNQEELDEIRGPGREQQEKALLSRALELGAFLKSVIESDASIGDVSVLAWSAGNSQTMALLAHANQLPDNTRELLGKHLRSHVIYEPSSVTTGGPVPSGLLGIKAARSPTMSLDDLATAFALSVSAYYPPFTFPDTIEPLPDYPLRRALHESSQGIDAKHVPTASRLSREELQAQVHTPPIDSNGSQYLLRILTPDVYRASVEKALFDRRYLFGGRLEEVWPRLRIHVIWCDMSVGDCIWSSVLLYFRHASAPGEWRRPMELHKLSGANHFVHWEEPERFLRLLVDIV